MSELREQALSVRHFARVNGISPGSVYKEIREGRLEARKIGRRTVITTPDADKWRTRSLSWGRQTNRARN